MTKLCPEHKVHGKLYGSTLVIDKDDVIISVQCQDCVASQGGCKHAIALLMWVHRRSEDRHVLRWIAIGRNPNYPELVVVKIHDSKRLGNPILPANSSVLKKFLEDCELTNPHIV